MSPGRGGSDAGAADAGCRIETGSDSATGRWTEPVPDIVPCGPTLDSAIDAESDGAAPPTMTEATEPGVPTAEPAAQEPAAGEPVAAPELSDPGSLPARSNVTTVP